MLYKDYDKKGKNSFWICQCDCGVKKSICATALRNGQKSCGCSIYENTEERRIKNKYYIDENGTVHAELRSGDEMLCDSDDWELLKKYTWTKNKYGYATTYAERKNMKFHIEVKGRMKGYVVDHIDRNRLNNQKSNLRFLTMTGNAINSSLSVNNTSGIKGVCRSRSGKWIAQIMLNGKHIHLGTYDTIEEAEKARKIGEEKYHLPILNNSADGIGG